MQNFKILIRIAWRNIWRNRRRAVLTLVTVVIGCGMIIFNNALFYGGTMQMVDDAVTLNAGHIQVHQKGYWKSKSIDDGFQPANRLTTFLDGLKGKGEIVSYSYRIQADAVINYNDTTSAATVQSIDPIRERDIISIQKRIVPGGRELNAGDKKIILVGESLAKNLGAAVGSEVSMVSRAFDGSIAAEKLVISGIISTGNSIFDQTMVLIPYAQAVETFAMMDFVHAVVIKLNDAGKAKSVARKIEDAMKGGNMEVLWWEDLIPEIIQFVRIDQGAGYIFTFILFMVVAFTILNTIQMSVYERTREFGIMLSIGTSPGNIFTIVMIESAMISCIGVAAGLVLGVGVSLFERAHPFDYSRFASEFAQWGVYTCVYPAKLTALNAAVSTLLCLALALAFSLVPAWRASMLNPVEAARHL
jgi:ABC-type lipoprotein release transport system permease subunit